METLTEKKQTDEEFKKIAENFAAFLNENNIKGLIDLYKIEYSENEKRYISYKNKKRADYLSYKGRIIQLNRVAKEVCKNLEINISDFKNSQKQEFVSARYIYFAEAKKKHPNYTLGLIGGYVKKNHSTASVGIKNVEGEDVFHFNRYMKYLTLKKNNRFRIKEREAAVFN